MASWGDRAWLITGASTGFGRAMADLVLSRGGRVVATARDTATLTNLVDGSGGRAIAVPLDVSDHEQATAAMARVEAFGGADVLFNNAGYGFVGGLEESSAEEIARQFDVNLFAPIRLAKAVLPGMRARGSGFIVNMSSIAGVKGFPGSPFYAGSKFGLEGVSEALAGEVAPFGIGVMIVEPGFFRTDFAGRSIRMTASPHPAYEALARGRARVHETDGAQPGDPARGVAAILSAMEAEMPPLRLALGADAYAFATAALDARRAELDRWAETTCGTDFAER
jgi:NAD(P)-dependent dehydrogenase (short-subunit alcohol dehydrogenase family)